ANCSRRPIGRGDRDQLPAHRRRQGRYHRRLRAVGRRSQSRDQGITLERDRGDGGPQPYVGRAATTVLPALLGERRRDEVGEGAPRRARQDSAREELNNKPTVWG